MPVVGPANEMVKIFDAKSGSVAFSNSTHFTRAIGELNLYPFLSLMPRTDPEESALLVFQFICDYSELVRISSSNDSEIETVAVLPKLPDGVCSHFSATGSGKMLALRASEDFQPEFITFGGTSFNSGEFGGCWSNVPALANSYRLHCVADRPERA